MPMNYVKTAMLLAVLTAIFVAVGASIGGQTGMVVAFVVALGMNFFSYWNSDKMVLRMYGAHEVDERSSPEYYGLVRELAQRAGAADAARLCHGQPAAQRLRHRPQSFACRRMRFDRAAAGAEPR